MEPFDPFRWGGPYCESSAWQATFAVPHDVEGLAALYGGPEAMCAKLDELFSAPPYYNPAGYGFVIHEMIEMARADFGQCAISNQPSFHLPYLYAMLGQPEKTAYWVERLCRRPSRRRMTASPVMRITARLPHGIFSVIWVSIPSAPARRNMFVLPCW